MFNKPFQNSNLTEKPIIEMHNAVSVFFGGSLRLMGIVYTYPSEHNLQPAYTGIYVGDNQDESLKPCEITTSAVQSWSFSEDMNVLIETNRSKYKIISWYNSGDLQNFFSNMQKLGQQQAPKPEQKGQLSLD
jgi:hypothetical protein